MANLQERLSRVVLLREAGMTEAEVDSYCRETMLEACDLLTWAIQELRRCDNPGYASHIADVLEGVSVETGPVTI